MRAIVSPDGRLTVANLVFRAAIGRNGMTLSKREGDGATPVGVMPLRRVLYRADRVRPPPSCAVPVEPISPDEGWCDAPELPKYNQLVRLPFPGSHEVLWRDDGFYDVIVILGYNDSPVLPGAGSAIFLHVAAPDYAPTAGCVALARADLLKILALRIIEIEISLA